MKKYHFISFIAILWLISCSVPISSTNDSVTKSTDYLVYSIYQNSEPQKLIFYDLADNTRSQILTGWTVNEFSFSTNNRLAFTSIKEGVTNLYILDFPFTENKPVQIHPAADFVRLSWSPDGHYLVFNSDQDDKNSLLLWDGNDIISIFHYHQHVGEFAWNSENQLAFTDFYRPTENGDSSEVFIWEGIATISASQNPKGEDRFPAWSEDGRFAFLSEQNGEHDIFIWDGKSRISGAPDIDTFINVAPELTRYYSDLTWTNSGSLAFKGHSPWAFGVQIFEWDGYYTTNISRNPLDNNGGQTWRNDGYWSFVTFFSDTEMLFIKDNKNRTVLKTNGKYSPAWSQNGLLLFCVDHHPGWTLSLWNGKEIIEIANGNTIIAQWNNGTGVNCSYG